MNLNLIRYLSLSAFCAAVTGCVNYDTNTQQKVRFYSEDTPEVTVSVNGEIIGETNCSAVLNRETSYSVVFSKNGYQPATYDLIPYEDPDTGVVAFIDEVYCPELEPAASAEAETAPAEPVPEVVPPLAEEPVAPAEEPVAEPEPVPADTEEPPVDEPTDEVVEPEVPAEPEAAPEVTEEPAVDPEVPETPVADVPEVTEEPEVAPEEKAEVPEVRTLTELRAELAEIKRQRKLNLISAEEFEKRTAALAEEVSRTY